MKKNKIIFILLIVLLICVLVIFLPACELNKHKHSYNEKYSADSEYHWHKCDNCDEKSAVSKHEFVLGVCVVCGYAQGTSGLEYSLNEDGVSYAVSSVGSVVTDNVTIPSYYNGKPVTIIGQSAFERWTGVSLVVGENIKVIEKNAFTSCKNLAKVKIKEGVTTISDSAFKNCITLDNITIPNSVKNLEGNVFYGCSNLKNVSIGNNLTTIESFTFKDCKNLTSITIPKNVEKIKSLAFEGCSGIESIQVDSDNTKYKSEGNCLLTKDGNILVLGCKDSVIPHSVTSIKAYAFYGCIGLTNIIIPESVINIGSCVFYGCSSLKSIVIPISVQTIGYSAFNDCNNLTIYCEAKSKPNDWNDQWNSTSCPVIWG